MLAAFGADTNGEIGAGILSGLKLLVILEMKSNLACKTTRIQLAGE